MPFRFRFKTLLRYREHLRTKAQTDLAIVTQRCAEAQSRLNETRAERRQQFQMLQEKRSAGISSTDYTLTLDYIGSLERQLLIQEEELQERSLEVVKAKGFLLQRQTEVKMLECLEAKDRVAFRKEQSKQELIKLDEKAVMGSSRNKSDQ
jgi:flagellar export protein FliJ